MFSFCIVTYFLAWASLSSWSIVFTTIIYTVGIGALYPPCMREDLSVQFLYSHYNFDVDEPLGCCEITSRNTAGSTTEQECHDITEGLLPTLLTLNEPAHEVLVLIPLSSRECSGSGGFEPQRRQCIVSMCKIY